MTSTAFMTDKYELTMAQAVLESGAAHRKAVFELFARKLPKGRRYGVVAGTARAIEAVTNFVFTEDQLAYLAEDPVFTEATIEYLRNYRFTGSIYGYAEGDVYFPYSPILTVEGTFADAVILETVLLSIFNYDSAVASAASRMVQASEGRVNLIEMGSRRAHDAAAVDAARAAYIAGFDSTSNLEAGLRYGVPTRGTAAHAFTLAHATEEEAFTAQMRALGVGTTLLVDTYDIEEGIRTAVKVANAMGENGPGAIRIDSGDLHEEPAKARRLLDELGASATKIVVSSDIDEYSIAELMERNTPVDGVGAGTRVVTGSGHPTAGMVFKLVEREDENGNMVPVAKKSASKKSVGGFKHAFRRKTYPAMEEGKAYTVREVQEFQAVMVEEYYSVAPTYLDAEDVQPLQIPYILEGEVQPMHTLEEIRAVHRTVMAELPEEAKRVTFGEAAFEAQERKV